MKQDITTTSDPKEKYPSPPYSSETQQPPGTSSAMYPKPDYGEDSYKGSGKLQGKAALITGGDSGIGRAVALAFAREGADVAFTYLDTETEKGDAEETVRLIKEAGRRALSIPGDISDEDFCLSLVEEALDAFKSLDILVNNAAYQRTYASIMDIKKAELVKAFETNVFGTFFMTQAVFPHLKPGGTIINTLSVQAFHPSAQLLPYAATKGALSIFTKAFSNEAIKRGVRVNGVAPGPIWTPLIASTMPEPQTFGENNPTERAGQPAELAPVYVLLASDDASFVNGEIWGVTGGSMAK